MQTFQPTKRCCVALLLATHAVLVVAQGADPAINAPYLDPPFELWQQRFETEGREVFDRRHDIIAAARARAGLRVADIGAGTGLFTRLFAEQVGEGGRVYAVDIAERFVRGNVGRAREAGYAQVTGVVNSQTDLNLPDASIDLAFICDAYHHFEQPQALLASLRPALARGGMLVVVDFERIPGVTAEWLLRHVRAGKAEVRREIEAAGFRFVEEVKLMKENYFLRFARD